MSSSQTNSIPAFWRKIVSGMIIGATTIAQISLPRTAANAQTGAYCRATPDAIAQKEILRQRATNGDGGAKVEYQAFIKAQGDRLAQCRNQNWPKTQAIWLRLHPCDARPGELDKVLDHIVNKGYNEVYVEVFYDSRVLLPAADNPTPWISVVQSRGAENVDLLADAIQKGRQRGLKVYAWMFTMNFGYAYGVRSDRQQTLARNGRGQDSTAIVPDGSQVFIDPYNRQAQSDYYQLLQSVLKRRPDGVLFDYIRYPRGSGAGSVASNVRDLWVYGQASQQVLLERAENNQGRELIQRFLNQGRITAGDISAVRSLYPSEGSPQWQNKRSDNLPAELWSLSVAHAAQGVLEFLKFSTNNVMQQRLPAGAVFFPSANKPVGNGGFDSRLQPWDSFSPALEWHAMAYSICGSSADCIVEEIRRVLNSAEAQTRVVPALAGVWGGTFQSHISLEAQMQAIRQQLPQLQAVSHFAYSWQERESDRARQFCQL
ncbi:MULTISPECIES: family 10 glycosylhydrolase [Spirulina sp. CCY15215]|uniref:family 10 glycosylhydrolase n=1 Tax=Spirulina sp. CCY15215 TaxID=2767591 RepID=UPI001950259C|nr:family 10 glycosylhydrolase [Spirulina major]